MIRRIAFVAVFAAVALSATGCCGTFRNLVYRIRHCNGCYPAYGGGCCDGGAVASPSYSLPIADAGPIMAPPAAGCASCGSSPVVPYPAAGVPVVPSYTMQPGPVPMTGAPVAAIK